MSNLRATDNQGFSPNDIDKAIQASLLDYNNKNPKKLTQQEQLQEARLRYASNFDSQHPVDHVPGRPSRVLAHQGDNEQVSSCNFKSIFKRGVKVTLTFAALGLAGYMAYNNIENIQNMLGSLQPTCAQWMTKATELGAQYGLTYQSIQGLLTSLMDHLNQALTTVLALTITSKNFLMNLPLKTIGKVATVALLLLIKAHKGLANVVIFLAKNVRNHTSLALTIALLAVVALYVPQANQYAAPYLARASATLMTNLNAATANNVHAAEALNFLAENAKLIGIVLLDLVVLGFVHKAVDRCRSNTFTGRGNRLA